MTASIFWYDFETTGINPRADRALQVAGIRTNENLEEITEPLNLYCQLSDDILPHPIASLITGITVEQMQHGLPEHEFIAQLQAELARPGTCTAGYNSIRFDDEVTRYTLYRNFYDPYAREWQGGNSRWDILDALRCAWALRPEGIQWPLNEHVRNTFKLELLTQANGIAHGQAHDALADVRATIAMARLLKEQQPKLYEYLYGLRLKNAVLDNLVIGQPAVHISGRFSVERHCLAIVLPVFKHPTNANAYVVCDLQSDITPLIELDGQQIKDRLYTRHSELAEDELPIPLKLIHTNKCPVVLPMSVLREQDIQRLAIDEQRWQANYKKLLAYQSELAEKLAVVFAAEEFAGIADPEQQLYQGFLKDRDRALSNRVKQATPEELAVQQWPFDDERLPELLFRYRARNYPASLTEAELKQWHVFCRNRLVDKQAGAPLTVQEYMAAFSQLSSEQQNSTLMQGWLARVRRLERFYKIT
ncbi:exodeoxyribonuclease I [Thiopseudomonas acetoxidans]|uniref:Exodeoxyribonuclease I n=1 Tax=Thiopseudomonas acetoxidans TaxID=3041622 RepID=A0ABT7SL36_9GAMM|nr:exodeoxyribonuclease I [Thiopseudomonas sp. CY1220]MDM7856895.1 exodeoxyribonuclease I [Thiopseudomonas sp. CY1220]